MSHIFQDNQGVQSLILKSLLGSIAATYKETIQSYLHSSAYFKIQIIQAKYLLLMSEITLLKLYIKFVLIDEYSI